MYSIFGVWFGWLLRGVGRLQHEGKTVHQTNSTGNKSTHDPNKRRSAGAIQKINNLTHLAEFERPKERQTVYPEWYLPYTVLQNTYRPPICWPDQDVQTHSNNATLHKQYVCSDVRCPPRACSLTRGPVGEKLLGYAGLCAQAFYDRVKRMCFISHYSSDCATDENDTWPSLA